MTMCVKLLYCVTWEHGVALQHVPTQVTHAFVLHTIRTRAYVYM